MLLEGCLHMGIPVGPGMTAGMFMIGVRNPALGKKGVEAPITIEQMVIGSAVKREEWHRLWVQLINERIAIEIVRIARPIPVLSERIGRWKPAGMRPDGVKVLGIF